MENNEPKRVTPANSSIEDEKSLKDKIENILRDFNSEPREGGNYFFPEGFDNPETIRERLKNAGLPVDGLDIKIEEYQEPDRGNKGPGDHFDGGIYIKISKKGEEDPFFSGLYIEEARGTDI